jgi:hypothetical protein
VSTPTHCSSSSRRSRTLRSLKTTQTHALEGFLTNPAENEVDIAVQNVSLTEIRKPPYKAAGDVSEAAVHVRNTLRTRPPDVRGANRLRDQRPRPERVRAGQSTGLQVTYFRVDQAFEETKQ